jgi:polyphenol oxidase
MHGKNAYPTRRVVLNLGLTAGLASYVGVWPSLVRAQQGAPINCAPINPPANATPFSPNTSLPMRVRKSAFDLTPPEIDRLKAAFAALRKLSVDDPLDPRGWLNQAHVHCWYCGGPQGDGTNAGTEIHGSWNFMPWHRAYLYFFERILAKLIGDDTFALPYWDWDTVVKDASGQTSAPHAALPLPYINPNGRTNPLYDELRLATTTERIPASYVGPTMMDPIMLNKNTELFFGSAPLSEPSVSGMVEFGPHGIVHIWVGDPLIRDGNGTFDMGVLATAAQDPIFFAHHGNIDRIWVNWLGQTGGGRANPTSPDWLNTTWTFFDENSRWTSIKASDVVDYEVALRYRYEEPKMPEAAMVAARTAPAGPTVVAQAPAPAGPKPAPLVLASPQQNLRLGPGPLTRSVALPAEHRSRMSMATPSTAGTPVIRIAGIEGPAGGAAIVRVFVNLPAANSATPVTDAHYVGYFTLVPNSLRGAHVHGHAGLNVELPLAAQTRELIGSGQNLSVTLVPVVGDNGAPLNLALKIGSISLATR